jgi:hypothetical protein
MSETCKNCGAELSGPYCHHCGQPARSNIRFFGALVHELFEDVFSFKSRAAITLSALFFRPGFLTAEYIAGRRVRYVPPLRLFLVTSLVCIFFVWLLNVAAGEGMLVLGAGGDSEVSAAAGPTSAEGEESVQPPAETADGGVRASVSLPGLSEENNRQLEARLRASLERIREDPNDFIGDLLEVIPRAMLFLVPLYALFMRVVYPFAGRLYVEHLLHAVHGHAFLFLDILLLVGLESGRGALAGAGAPGLLLSLLETLRTLLWLWIPLYFLLSLRRVYAQGWGMTLWKWTLLSIAYLVLAAVSAVALILVSVLLA